MEQNLTVTVDLLSFVVALLSYILVSWFTGKVFAKTGTPAWKGWVPIYNTYIFLKIGGFGKVSAFIGVLITCIPIINLVGSIILLIMILVAAYKIGLGFGKSGSWVILYFFLSIVWLGILAFDKTIYKPNIILPNQFHNNSSGNFENLPSTGSFKPDQTAVQKPFYPSSTNSEGWDLLNGGADH